MTKTRLATVTFVEIALACAVAGYSQQPAKNGAQPDSNDSVHTITLPQYSTPAPDGPHVDTYRKDCLQCHSTRYVLMQPRLSQAVWEKEVKKMIDAFGAVIPDADQREIVEYLVTVRGASESK